MHATDALRLACADSAFPRLSHAAALAVIRDLGIAAVDVCVFAGYDHTPPPVVMDDPRRAAAAVAERLDGLVVSDVFAILGSSFEDLAVNHPDATVRAESLRQFEHLVTFAAALHAPGVTLLPGMPFDDADASLERAAAELRRRAEIAGDAGLRLAVEPHYESVAATPDRALALVERAPAVGLALDHSHFVFQGIAQEDADVLLPHARHVHLRQARPGNMQTRVTEGTIDFKRLRDQLLAAGYTGYFALEYQWEDGWLDFSHVDCIVETAELRDVMLDA